MNKQEGFVLLELLTALPLLLALMLTMMCIFLFGMKTYFQNLADIELEQEIQTAASRITEDLVNAESVEKIHGSSPGVYIMRRAAVFDKQDLVVTYRVYNQKGLKKLGLGDSNAPLTGEHALAGVTITEFVCAEDKEKKGLVHLRLTGRSLMTKHVYAITTAVYLRSK